MSIRRKFPILVIAHPLCYLYPSFLPVETTNNNGTDITLHAVLAGQNGALAPGDCFLLNVELHNPHHLRIKCVSIDLVQRRTIGMDGHCALTISLLDLPHLRGFSGESYRETVELTIPTGYQVIPPFYYIPSAFSGKPIAVEYMLKLEVKIRGFFKNPILNISVVLRSNQTYMEAPPPPYDLVVATH